MLTLRAMATLQQRSQATAACTDTRRGAMQRRCARPQHCGRAWRALQPALSGRRCACIAASGNGSFDSSSSNLGQLNRYTEQPPPDDAMVMMQRVAPSSFASRGMYVDGSSVFASAVLLVMMLAFSFNRILGLDRLLTQAARAWKERRDEERRGAIMEARLTLDAKWDGADGTGLQGSDSGDKPPGAPPSTGSTPGR